MKRVLWFALCAVAGFPLCALAQQPDPSEEKGTYLGVLFSPVPDVVYDQVPELPRGQGVVVTHVLPDSPAAQAKLQRHDIVLQYDDEKVRDCEHFARLIRADKPERKLKLTILRAGKQLTIETTLATGPVLRIGRLSPAGATKETVDTTPKGTAKPGAPNSVSVTALPLGEGKLKVTIEYYDDGRLRTATCSGVDDDIESKVKELPDRVQVLTRVALKRIRAYDLQNAQNPTSPSKP